MSYLPIWLNETTSQLVFVNHLGEVANKAKSGDELKFDYTSPTTIAPVKPENATVIGRLPLTATIPSPKIGMWVAGPVEEFTLLSYSSNSGHTHVVQEWPLRCLRVCDGWQRLPH